MMDLHRFGFGGSTMFAIMGILAMLVFAALVTLCIVFLVRYLNSKAGHPSNYQNQQQNYALNALAILNERYAKGEIDDEEYKRKKTELTRP